MAEEKRKVEILNDSNEWEDIPFKDLKKGDVFRIYDADGNMFGDKDGRAIFIAQVDAFEHDGKNVIKYESYNGDRARS